MISYIIPDALEATAYLAAIITSSEDAIISKELNGNITSWNPSAERMFGYTAKEAIGRHISLIIPADRIKEEDYIIGQVRQGLRIEHFETIRRTKEGKEIHVAITVSPIKDDRGKVIGASKIARDITELKKAERANAYLSAIIESSDDAVISKDMNGFITSWNKSAERMFGYTTEEVVGKHITIIIPTERLDEEDKILNTLKSGRKIDHFQTWRRHKDGHLLPISLTVSPIRDSANHIIGASKIARDISDRLRADEIIKEANRKKDEFLANMSHELRTPMNAVIGLSQLLGNLPSLPDQARKMVDTLKVSADNLMELINDLLDFAKIESGSIQMESVEFDLAEQLEKIISVINVKAHEKALTLYINYASSLNRYFIGDPLRIHQILMNLLSNAVKFTDEGSIEVDITGMPDPVSNTTRISVKVSDTGIGIAADKLSAIFEKFIQADSSITRRYGGSGLGLAITKALVEKMGGAITVESQPGIGTAFLVTLPLKNTEKTSGVATLSTAVLNKPVKQKNVLLVEDYEPNVLVAGMMLELLGYDYDVARNGLEAIRQFMHGKYDVILMDMQMHDLDGLEASRRIRRMEKEKGLKRTPIIAMTAHVREQDKGKCMDAGMDDFIPKPFEQAALSQKVAYYVPKRKDDSKPVSTHP